MIYGNNELLALAVVYARAKGVKLSTVGRYACGNTAFFEHIGRGKSSRTDKAEIVSQWFADNWPEGVPWPLKERAA